MSWQSDPHQTARDKATNAELTVTLERLIVRRDGYTKSGDYFGTPGVVYCVSGDIEGCLRADSISAAMSALRKRWPNVKREK